MNARPCAYVARNADGRTWDVLYHCKGASIRGEPNLKNARTMARIHDAMTCAGPSASPLEEQ